MSHPTSLPVPTRNPCIQNPHSISRIIHTNILEERYRKTQLPTIQHPHRKTYCLLSHGISSTMLRIMLAYVVEELHTKRFMVKFLDYDRKIQKSLNWKIGYKVLEKVACFKDMYTELKVRRRRRRRRRG